MKELNRTKRLLVFSLLFVVIIIIGLLTIQRPYFNYQLNAEEALSEALSLTGEYFPEEVPMLVEYEDPAFQLIDIRSPGEFLKGHIETAINVPVYNLLDPDITDLLSKLEDDSVTIILYGKDQLEANAPWLLLKQLGYENIKVLLGGYDYYVNGPLDFYDMPETPEYLVEEPKYDFAAIIENAGLGQSTSPSNEPELIIPTKRKKKSVVEGGC
jgi:rhodanese-related sulfurtransferase